MSYPTPAATPPDSVEQRRQRRAAAGRSGGEFELIRQGDLFTLRYASPDPRCHEVGGHYSWEQTSSADGLFDIEARSDLIQSQAGSTTITSPSPSAHNDDRESPSGTSNIILVDTIEQDPLLGASRHEMPVESMYSRGFSGKEIHGAFDSSAVSDDASEKVSDGATNTTSRASQQHSVAGHDIAGPGNPGASMVDGMESRLPGKKKSFARMKSVKPLVKKIMQKGKRAAVRKMIQVLKSTSHRMSLVVKEDNEIVADDRGGLHSRRQGFTYHPSTPKARMIGQKCEGPIKEQLSRENDHDLPHPKLDKDFFTQPGDEPGSNKEPTGSPDGDVVDKPISNRGVLLTRI